MDTKLVVVGLILRYGQVPAVIFVLLVPAPIKLRALPEIVTGEVHVQLPAGTVTVSPVEAEFIADCTADEEHEAAVIFAARAVVARQRKMKEKRSNNVRFILIPFVDLSNPPNPLVTPAKTDDDKNVRLRSYCTLRFTGAAGGTLSTFAYS